MLSLSASRPKCLAGGGPLERRVGPHSQRSRADGQRLETPSEQYLLCHVQRAHDLRALERLGLGVLRPDRHQPGHFLLGQADFLAAELGQRHRGEVGFAPADAEPLAAARQVGKVVFTSSLVTVPLRRAGEPPATEADWQTDLSVPYFAARTAAERHAWDMAEKYAVKLVTLLPGAVCGPAFTRTSWPRTSTVRQARAQTVDVDKRCVVLQGGEVPTLALSTLDGALQLSGSGQWVGNRLRFAGEASATPEREAALSNLLNIIGRRNGARSIITIG